MAQNRLVENVSTVKTTITEERYGAAVGFVIDEHFRDHQALTSWTCHTGFFRVIKRSGSATEPAPRVYGPKDRSTGLQSRQDPYSLIRAGPPCAPPKATIVMIP